jgi:hypothetical protein
MEVDIFVSGLAEEAFDDVARDADPIQELDRIARGQGGPFRKAGRSADITNFPVVQQHRMAALSMDKKGPQLPICALVTILLFASILQKPPLNAPFMRWPGCSLTIRFQWVRGMPYSFDVVAWRAIVVCFHLSSILNCASDILSHLRFRQGQSCSKGEQSSAWPSCHAGSLKRGGSRRGCGGY